MKTLKTNSNLELALILTKLDGDLKFTVISSKLGIDRQFVRVDLANRFFAQVVDQY